MCSLSCYGAKPLPRPFCFFKFVRVETCVGSPPQILIRRQYEKETSNGKNNDNKREGLFEKKVPPEFSVSITARRGLDLDFGEPERGGLPVCHRVPLTGRLPVEGSHLEPRLRRVCATTKSYSQHQSSVT